MRSIFVLFFLSVVLLCNSQQNKSTAIFGIHIEPIIPSEMFRIRTQQKSSGDVKYEISPNAGYLFGGHLAVNISNRFAVESGINVIKRKFEIQATHFNRVSKLDFAVQNYEIPFAITYYVRLGEQLYMGHTLGASLQFLPTHLGSKIKEQNVDGTDFEFSQLSVKKSWIVPIYKGGVGLEYRTKAKGSYYIGVVYHLFRPLYDTVLSYKDGVFMPDDIVVEPIGDMFGIILRYNFKASKLK